MFCSQWDGPQFIPLGVEWAIELVGLGRFPEYPWVLGQTFFGDFVLVLVGDVSLVGVFATRSPFVVGGG